MSHLTAMDGNVARSFKEGQKSAEEAEERKKWLKAKYEQRLLELDGILTAMKGAPEFEDVEEVVSQEHFDDMVTALAMFHVSENGGDIEETSRRMEYEIWNLPNPYLYMYEMIKKFHPRYAGAEVDDDGDREHGRKNKGKHIIH
ncbi:MAG TPA: hypothetical protein PLU95_10585 [Syntrophales bacterium]|nr:hypothetical protein [Syntrophales bacterium]HPN09740.1 hypothetical protein [Syntrophales bacterium]HPX80835.1 hypothetical protein [Syntrophales bacterium]HQB14262.1 hypothetical protein [Syntrophales bacterium]